MAFSDAVKATIAKLLQPYFNSNVATPSNPGGFDGDGHVVNFPQALQDIASVASAIGVEADRFGAAVDAIQTGPVNSVNGRTGAVSGLAELASPTFTGDPKAPTPVTTDNDTSIATTGFVRAVFAAFVATGAELRALTDNAKIVTARAHADAMALVTEAATATIAPDFALGFNRLYTMGLNATLGQPTNLRDGLPVILRLVQDGTGGRTLSFNATYHKFPGGAVPTLSTAANAVDRLSGLCVNRGGTLVVEWSGIEMGIT